MIEEIRPDLYRIEIPLPNTSLKSLNSYFIRGAERHLVVDTGFDIRECHEAMQAGFNALDVDPDRTDYFITHMHMDHFGLVKRLTTPSSKIYFNTPDANVMRAFRSWDNIVAFAARHGFPDKDIQGAIEKNMRHKMTNKLPDNLVFLEDGDALDAGPYHLRCVQTPGHSFGHLCLYDAGRKLFIAGDHLLKDISPTIQSWNDAHNPLKWYLESLDKVYDLDIDLVLPGHRGLIHDHRARIDELKIHHYHRCLEIEGILETAPMSAYEVAARMTWNIRGKSFQNYPIAQQWFAMCEAISHLKYLEEKCRITRAESDHCAAVWGR
jgi:glyoxylase-like metal-dependent hydrolase (beta-lactamase superfamily II)